jgi:hypothetical protein
MPEEQKTQSALAAFVERNRTRLVGTLVGAIALACVAQTLPQNDTTLVGEAKANGSLQVSEKLDAVLATRTPEQTFLASAAAIVEVGDLDEIKEAIGDKRARLENAAKELENLEDMVASAEGLDTSDRDEAIASALLIYNESLAGAEFEVGVNTSSERAQNAWKSAESSTDLLMALHPMQ